MKKVLFLILISFNISFSQKIEVSVNKNPVLVGESFAISFSFDEKANNIDFNFSRQIQIKTAKCEPNLGGNRGEN